MGFNKEVDNKFFELVENVININKIDVERVWNVDETGISTVPKSLSKVISTIGKRQVGSLTSAERGQLVTAVVCCSASGRYMPPMLIFSRQGMKAELMDGAPPGAWAECHPSGWIQNDLFINWLKKFILHTEVTKDSPVLLILDGHATHTKSIELIDIARENGVILLCLPRHCTHKMQPLDILFMKPLSTFYDHNLRKWLRTNPGRVVTQFQIASLFGASYLDTATMTNAINGFKKAGIWPVDRSVFTDADFIAAEVTDMSIITEDTESFATTDSALTTVSAPATKPSDSTSTTEPSTSCTGSTSATEPSTSCRPSTSTTVTLSFAISPCHLLPIPKQAQRKRISKQRGKTAILTSSPYKRSLMEANEKKNPKKNKSVKKSNEDTPCLYCEDLSSSTESWVSCTECHRWAHYSCAGIDERNKKPYFLCELCTSSD
ncbi:uncharacterized protein LOC124815277 [Hydra vulgaris]|uniref:uncharacterized protein LOC124815277 n=1 Tax=Hydra vulgaris TaxID=6087 RepID=UPI001F5F0618|nr:uncharacterized protein LOC124815277 [Hydra vulgaris]